MANNKEKKSAKATNEKEDLYHDGKSSQDRWQCKSRRTGVA